MDDVIKLINETYQKNRYGVSVPTKAYTEVFCKVDSIKRAEFYSAGRNGLNPSYEFTVFTGDYNGEKMIEYNGESYAVYRTYKQPGTDYMELYVQQEGGTNGKESDS